MGKERHNDKRYSNHRYESKRSRSRSISSNRSISHNKNYSYKRNENRNSKPEMSKYSKDAYYKKQPAINRDQTDKLFEDKFRSLNTKAPRISSNLTSTISQEPKSSTSKDYTSKFCSNEELIKKEKDRNNQKFELDEKARQIERSMKAKMLLQMNKADNAVAENKSSNLINTDKHKDEDEVKVRKEAVKVSNEEKFNISFSKPAHENIDTLDEYMMNFIGMHNLTVIEKRKVNNDKNGAGMVIELNDILGGLDNKEDEEDESNDYYKMFMSKVNQPNQQKPTEQDDIVIENIQDHRNQELLNEDPLEEIELQEESDDEWTKLKSKLNKKVVVPVDHSKIQYEQLIKNLYKECSELSKKSDLEIEEYRKINGDIHIRGKDPVKPIYNWHQSGLPLSIINFLVQIKKYENPFPIQAQALPALMSGRDVIGIAETGSGKTLAYLLPMLRHILVQRPLKVNEGPIGLIIVPSRELAWQIYQEAQVYCKLMNLEISCVFGGIAAQEQISRIKRGSHILVCTPGRMIEMLSLNNSTFLSLKRCSFVVLDEADRMFDLGFEPQIKKIIMNARPDKQLCMFSATFHQQVECQAKKMLDKKAKPLEIIVGVKGKACGNITQRIEIVEERNKFNRLLEILASLDQLYDSYPIRFDHQRLMIAQGEDLEPFKEIEVDDSQIHTNDDNFEGFGLRLLDKKDLKDDKTELKETLIEKAIPDEMVIYQEPKILIFIDKKEEADELFKHLLFKGYNSLVIHSGQEQEDRFSFIDDFKSGLRNVLIATSVMARGLDVPDLEYVINFSCPNHFEDYVHRIGRTGRAGRKGTAITFISPDEEHLADVLIKALELSKQEIPHELYDMHNKYLVKLENREASQFKRNIVEGRGYKYDDEEALMPLRSKQNFKKMLLASDPSIADIFPESNEEISNQDSHSLQVKQEETKLMRKIELIRNKQTKQELIEKVKLAVANSLISGNSIEEALRKAELELEREMLNIRQKVSLEKSIKKSSQVLDSWEKQHDKMNQVCSMDLYINEYPEHVRLKIKRREFKSIIEELTSCQVEVRGTFSLSMKSQQPGTKKLHLHIRGPNNIEVSKAYTELKRMCDSLAVNSFTHSNNRYNKY